MSTLAPITGIEEVQEYMRTLPREIVMLSFLQGLQAARAVIVPVLIANTPERKDESLRSEDQRPLRECVDAKVKLDEKGQGGSLEVGFWKNANIALWVERGHRKVGHKPGLELLGQVPAYPFIGPTMDECEVAALEAFENSLAQTMRSHS